MSIVRRKDLKPGTIFRYAKYRDTLKGTTYFVGPVPKSALDKFPGATESTVTKSHAPGRDWHTPVKILWAAEPEFNEWGEVCP